MFLCPFQVPGDVGFFTSGGMTATDYDDIELQKLIDFNPDVCFVCLGGNDIRPDSDPSDLGSIHSFVLLRWPKISILRGRASSFNNLPTSFPKSDQLCLKHVKNTYFLFFDW